MAAARRPGEEGKSLAPVCEEARLRATTQEIAVDVVIVARFISHGIFTRDVSYGR